MAFTTRKSLLNKIKQGDEISWKEFYASYRPLILLRSGDLGLTQTEKEDLVQIVMAEFFKGSRDFQYDRSRGRFRDYLKSIINNQAVSILRKRKNLEVGLDDHEFILANGLEQAWDDEWQGHLMNMAMDELKNCVEPVTYQAFYLYAMQGQKSAEVAEFLNMSVNSIYVAKNRCLEQLKKIIADVSESD
jgi:RNA polymerase sigma-70 factor (ECF subfamily)